MIVWVVTGTTGEYSDRSWWVVGIAKTLAEAERLAITDKPRDSFETGPVVEPELVEPGITQVYLGHSNGGDYTGTDYYAEAFSLKGE